MQLREPLPADDPLWSVPGITITPHIAAQSSPRTIAEQFLRVGLRTNAGLTGAARGLEYLARLNRRFLPLQDATLKPGDPQNCLRRFRANSTTGWIVFAGLLVDALTRF